MANIRTLREASEVGGHLESFIENYLKGSKRSNNDLDNCLRELQYCKGPNRTAQLVNCLRDKKRSNSSSELATLIRDNNRGSKHSNRSFELDYLKEHSNRGSKHSNRSVELDSVKGHSNRGSKHSYRSPESNHTGRSSVHGKLTGDRHRSRCSKCSTRSSSVLENDIGDSMFSRKCSSRCSSSCACSRSSSPRATSIISRRSNCSTPSCVPACGSGRCSDAIISDRLANILGGCRRPNCAPSCSPCAQCTQCAPCPAPCQRCPPLCGDCLSQQELDELASAVYIRDKVLDIISVADSARCLETDAAPCMYVSVLPRCVRDVSLAWVLVVVLGLVILYLLYGSSSGMGNQSRNNNCRDRHYREVLSWGPKSNKC